MDRFNKEVEKLDQFESNYMKLYYYDFNKKINDNYTTKAYVQLCTIIEGEKQLNVNKSETESYDKEESVILPPYSTVEMDISKPTKALVLELNGDLIHKVSQKMSISLNNNITLPKNFSCQKNDEINISGVLDNIKKLALNPKKEKGYLLDLYAQEITFHLLNSNVKKFLLNSKLEIPLQKGINLMHESLDLSLKEIAFRTNMSLSNFSLQFKKYMGENPNSYYKKLRLNKSRELLKTKSVTEVSYEIGFNTVSYYIKCFNDMFGLTPKQYQLKKYF